jgi:hypothetical protein
MRRILGSVHQSTMWGVIQAATETFPLELMLRCVPNLMTEDGFHELGFGSRCLGHGYDTIRMT